MLFNNIITLLVLSLLLLVISLLIKLTIKLMVKIIVSLHSDVVGSTVVTREQLGVVVEELGCMNPLSSSVPWTVVMFTTLFPHWVVYS